jgi:Flp pilus assembly protein TadG
MPTDPIQTNHNQPSNLIDRLARRRSGADHEGGYVLVMLSLMFVLLMLFACYSVDAGNWNLHRNETQTAAEAAALGGVAFLPGDLPNAIITAEQIALHHGYASSQVNVELGGGDNQLRVTITEDVSNYFVRVIGMDTTSIVSNATAEFEQPVEMGSPEHILGNDPETGYAPDYWLSIAARGVKKDLGDRFNTRRCNNEHTANCSGRRNQEYDSSGYKYSVRVTDPTVPLRIQIFDPAWVWTGSTCDIPEWPSAADLSTLESYEALYPEIPTGYYSALTAPARYAGGDGPYCVGDDRPGGQHQRLSPRDVPRLRADIDLCGAHPVDYRAAGPHRRRRRRVGSRR